ncbi:MAG: hypothetical protein CL853_03190 [Crocinitomicaceae bacterium]|nr:hypothetical protein [Crocinitomicaceae bacterium]|tara:strand:- start:712 stop:1377 length:666 start_codon:yes stop_codon:yes gene_type:complete
MRNIFTFLLIIQFLNSPILIAQGDTIPSINKENLSYGNIIELSKESIFITAYTRAFDLNIFLLEISNAEGPGADRVTNYGFGGTFSYLFTPYIGIGIDVNYSDVCIGWYTLGVAQNGVKPRYNHQAGVSNLRIAPRIDVIPFKRKKITQYFSFVAGYTYKKFYFTSTQPDRSWSEWGGEIPITLRLSTGAIISFTKHIGLNLEAGVGGGGLLRGGFVFKLK